LRTILKLQLSQKEEYKFFLNRKSVRILINLKTNILYIIREFTKELKLNIYLKKVPEELLPKEFTEEKLVF
jgi:hypothetical protein